MTKVDWISLFPMTGTLCQVQGPFYAQGTANPGDTNAGPLSICRDPGSPNSGIISFSNALATPAAVSVLSGNASTHPENMSTRGS